MRIARAALLAFATLGASAALAAPNWLTTVDTSDGGHKIGNPAAKVKLAEFVSYTCPHCGAFQQQAGNALDLYVGSGKLQLDVRHVIRDPVDLTAAMLANCGPSAKFPRNHKALMAAQTTWLAAAKRATAGQRARWSIGAGSTRRQAIASDLKFYDLMATRGYERIAVDKCLADEPMAKRLAAQSAADDAKWKIAGTPSFVLDGAMQPASDWPTLRKAIDAKL